MALAPAFTVVSGPSVVAPSATNHEPIVRPHATGHGVSGAGEVFRLQLGSCEDEVMTSFQPLSAICNTVNNAISSHI